MARSALSVEPASKLELTGPQRVEAYRIGMRVRAAITQCLIEMRKGTVRFWIGGPGEEVHGAATAFAIHHFDAEVPAKDKPASTESWASPLFPHYRSDALATLLAELRGHPDFTRAYFRQALSRATDEMTRGRQMVMHLCDVDRGIMPVQSPLGMNLSKAAGYARGMQALGRRGVAVAVCGDGTTATSDFHECFTAASIWRLPLLVIVTDNRMAISVTPDEGRGIKDYGAYAKAFGAGHITCDGFDLQDTYRNTLGALRWVRDTDRACLLHVRVPRLRGHSSSDGAVFRYDERDPIMELGQQLAADGLLAEDAILRRKPDAAMRDWFEDHDLGRHGQAELARVRATVEQVRQEPAPAAGSELDDMHPPLPEVDEPRTSGTTAVQINEALNLCLHRMVDEGNTLAWGQDIAGDKGGVFKVTRGLSQKRPDLVCNAPINEPLIIGTALGAAHHPELRLVPEIQFGDYSLNTLHWLVHAGNVHWGSAGRISPNLTLRTPVDPVAGGALYHSMSVDGYFTPVQGWVILCPSTSFDAYGLLRAAGDYPGPVLILEPKVLYRRAVGDKLPGEPDGGLLRRLRRSSGESLLSAGDLTAIADFRIPFGKARERRAGADLTIVTWGNSTHQALTAAQRLAHEHGVEATVIDLRSLSPWDVAAVEASARATGRLLIAQQDRTFAGFGREVQATIHERVEGIASLAVGMRNVPAVAQAKELEASTVLHPPRIADAALDLCRRPAGAFVCNENAWLQFAPTRRGA